MNCGSCFFELPNGLVHLPEDQPSSLGIEAFYLSRRAPIHSVKNAIHLMQQSADRGCITCKALRAFMSVHISAQNQLMWNGLYADSITASFNPLQSNSESAAAQESGDKSQRPSNVIFDLFCQASDTDESIPAFECQSTRSFHPFLSIASHPSGDTESDLATSRLQRWLTACVASHTLCRAQIVPPLPGRVLWLETPDSLRVIENCPSTQPYACLSHRWSASTEKISLLSTNLNRYKSGLSASSLPRLFRDVIGLCQRLDLQYLWIDSLCIIQDSLTDWETVAATMGSIYENAFVTISADWNTDSDQSLFSCIPPAFRAAEIPTPAIRLHSGEEGKVFIRRQLPHPAGTPTSNPGTFAPDDLPFQRRGWVFQERALSKRIIHFTQFEVSWECVERTCCECRLNEGHWIAARLRAPRTVFQTSWERIVEEYSLLELSFEKDKLQALAGISRRLAEHTGWLFMAGLWREGLETGFLWRRLKYSPTRARPAVSVAPTWSWAAVNGPV